jgi:serine protease Do
MDEYIYNTNEPDTYQTGRTGSRKRPLRSLFWLLGLVVFLGVLGLTLKLAGLGLFFGSSGSSGPNLSFCQPTEDIADRSEDFRSPTPDGNEWVLPISDSPLSVENIPQEGGLSLQAIYEKAVPSVVSISCDRDGSTSTGTGVVFRADGYLITNCHVVENARQIQVLFTDGRELPAALVGSDRFSDLAVLSVEADDLIAAEFGNSDALRVGDTVVAIGDPLGVALRGSMTNGIVSAINRGLTVNGRTMSLIQTNAALNPGSSGGPLLNCYGQVVGINTLKIGDYMSDAGVEGLGFSIPSSFVKDVVGQLMEKGYVSGRPSLGFTCETVSTFHQIYSHLPAGVYVTAITPGGAAQRAGILPGDIILSISGVRITDAGDLEDLLFYCQPQDRLRITLFRDGKQYLAELTVDSLD